MMRFVLIGCLAVIAAFGAAHFVKNGGLGVEAEAVQQTNGFRSKSSKTADWSRSSGANAGAGGRIVRLKAGRNGHFHTNVKINGRPIPFMVDTGASLVSISYEHARQIGLKLKKSDFKYVFNTANGQTHVAIVTLKKVQLGGIRLSNVRAAVSQKGALATAGLLGNSFLSRLSEYRVENGTLVLKM